MNLCQDCKMNVIACESDPLPLCSWTSSQQSDGISDDFPDVWPPKIPEIEFSQTCSGLYKLVCGHKFQKMFHFSLMHLRMRRSYRAKVHESLPKCHLGSLPMFVVPVQFPTQITFPMWPRKQAFCSAYTAAMICFSCKMDKTLRWPRENMLHNRVGRPWPPHLGIFRGGSVRVLAPAIGHSSSPKDLLELFRKGQ